MSFKKLGRFSVSNVFRGVRSEPRMIGDNDPLTGAITNAPGLDVDIAC